VRRELTDEVREQAFAYVDAVVAAAEGAGQGAPESAAGAPAGDPKPLAARLVPGAVKRAVVRALIYVMRHPFDHLAHPVQVKLEEEIGQSRGIAQAALMRAEDLGSELRRLRAELDRERRRR
jgi:hypothetical protein